MQHQDFIAYRNVIRAGNEPLGKLLEEVLQELRELSTKHQDHLIRIGSVVRYTDPDKWARSIDGQVVAMFRPVLSKATIVKFVDKMGITHEAYESELTLVPDLH